MAEKAQSNPTTKELPEHIQSEFGSRMGRAGRGRLWIPPHIELKGIDWNEKSPLAKFCSEAGGVVFEEEFLDKMLLMPGIVTNLNLLLVEKPRMYSLLELKKSFDDSREIKKVTFGGVEGSAVLYNDFYDWKNQVGL